MPKRPREHELEELSRRAFADALPARWVHRPLNPDYGLDETVEIFEANGNATGLSFHVQLKATDEPDLAVALRSIRFRRELTEYYRSLALPVSVVLYHAPTGRLFARWFHAYNPHVAIRGAPPPVTKTVRFEMSERDEWGASTPDDLAAGARGFVAFRSPELPLPLRFSVSHDGDADEGTVYRYVFALRAALNPVADLISVEAAAPAAGQPSIVIGTAATVVSLADVASVTLDHDAAGSHDPAALASNIAVAIATVLAHVGQPNLAAQVGAATAGSSDTILDAEVAFTLAGAMARSRRLMDALHLADALDARRQGEDDGEEDARVAAFVIQTVAQSRTSRLNAEERRLATEVGEHIMERAEARGDGSAAGAAAYNLAMLHRGGRDAERAIAAFRRAVEIDPSYDDRAYFHSDLAGVLFESGEFAEAAEHYGKAVAMGADQLRTALHADALLFSGRYAEAQELLDQYLASDVGPERAEWRLKRRILPRIRALAGDAQERLTAKALDLAESVDFTGAKGDMPIEEAEAVVAEALRMDALCAEAWFRQGLLALNERDEPGDGLEPAIISAVLYRVAIGAWLNAVMLARAADAPEEVVADVLRTAYRFNGDAFVDELVQAVSQHHGADDPALLALVNTVVVEVDAAMRDEAFVMRLPGEGGDMIEFAFGPDSA